MSQKIFVQTLLLGALTFFWAEPALAFQDSLNTFFGWVNTAVASVLLFDLLFFSDNYYLPFAVMWLMTGATILTLRLKFINFRAFAHGIRVLRGKHTEPGEEGEVSHLAALTMALSATVGLGNIAGVAIAVSIGGPGATFWMIVAGLLGMTSKFSEVTLAQKYRKILPDGHVRGGPMEYLRTGLKEKGFPRLGVFLSGLFAFMAIGGSFAGGGSFQVNQSLKAIEQAFPFFQSHNWVYGAIMTLLVGLVILGGIKRIAKTAQAVVPSMCLIYLSACIYILAINASFIPWAFAEIFNQAFATDSIYGGVVGVLIVGFQRAAFSNEAGVGSAAIAHAAAKTKHPAREGVVALLEPFIDTVVICTITALMIIITGAYNNPEYAMIVEAREGAALTSVAMGSQISWFPYILGLSVFLFAFSTIISWSYYGERCFTFLFGERSSLTFKILLLIVIFLGSITSATNVLEFGDLMILGMSVPNILGIYFLTGVVVRETESYWNRFKGT